MKVEALRELEAMAAKGLLELYYGDESRVNTEPCVPYGWQFQDEKVFMPSAKGAGVNCFALLNRLSDCWFATTQQRLTSAFLLAQLEQLSFVIKKLTVVVLDNAPMHTARKVQERRRFWEQRGLLIFYLPPYSPHLNLAETLWRKLKYEWLEAADYRTTEGLFYQVRQILAAVGKQLKINFADFNFGLT